MGGGRPLLATPLCLHGEIRLTSVLATIAAALATIAAALATTTAALATTAAGPAGRAHVLRASARADGAHPTLLPLNPCLRHQPSPHLS